MCLNFGTVKSTLHLSSRMVCKKRNTCLPVTIGQQEIQVCVCVCVCVEDTELIIQECIHFREFAKELGYHPLKKNSPGEILEILRVNSSQFALRRYSTGWS